MSADAGRLPWIRARLAALEQGYAVHVTCGSEVEYLGFRCCKCGPISRDEIAAPQDGLDPERVAADLRYLLELVERKPSA